MAGRNEGCGAIGCAGLCFIALLFAMCTGGGSGESADGGYVPPDSLSYSVSAPIAAPPVVVEDARPPDTPRALHVGPRGGCYYISDSGSKTYVDRSECAGIRAPVAPEPLIAPQSESSSGEARSSAGRQLHVGSRGGCYYLDDSGDKTYVDRAECAGIRTPVAPQPLLSSPSESSSGGARRSSGGRQLHVGPRGGCYYINGNGNKTYVDRSECH
jgi:hypothetical protein